MAALVKLTIVLVITFFCFLAACNAAITPQDDSYEVPVKTDFVIPWAFDNVADMQNVDWSFKSTSAASTTTIMTKAGNLVASVTPGYDVEHVTNGQIKLNTVDFDDSGIYYCTVTYTFASSLPIVTGTATISVTEVNTTTSTPPTTTSTTPTTSSTTSTTTITTPTTSTIVKPKTTISTTAASTTTINNSSEGKLVVIIVSSVVGGLLFVGIAIAALFIFHRQRNKKHTTRNKRHLGRDHHKLYKTSKSPNQQKNDHYLYNGRSHNGRSQVKENPLNRVSKERSLSRSYYTGASSRYDNYRVAYTMEHVYPSSTIGHRFMSEYIGENRNPKKPKHSSYPMGNLRYTDNRIFYY